MPETVTPPSTYVAEPELEIEGQPAPAKLMEDLLQLSIEESLHLPSMFTIVVNNPAFPGQSDKPTLEPGQANKKWDHEQLFAIGKAVRIGFRNSTTASSEFQVQEKDWLIVGEITAIETHFTSGSQAPIIIRGYDRSHRLHRGHHNRSFQNMTDTDIVNKIIREVDLPAGSIEDSGAPHDYVFQENQTNLEFLRERAARNGFELFVQNGKLNFRKPKNDQTLELTWLKQLTSFQVRVTSAEQVDAVEVRGWNYKQKKAIVATRNQDTSLTKTDHGKGKTTSSAFQGKPDSPKLIVVDQPIATQQEADKIAQSLFDELCDEFVHADARAQGHPSIRPGRVVKLKGMGKYSGDYYITETHHSFSERVYTTAFSIRGLRGGDLLSLLAPPTRLQPGQTLLIGQVTNNDDPEGLGRVRVQFPTLTEDHESDWARVVAIGAGKNRGFDCLPEIDDEVLVGFEHGDIHRPFVIGGLWNGSDDPPESVSSSVMGSKVRLRTIKTRTGHQIQFVEEPNGGSQAGITIKTVGGHLVQMNDTDRSITLSSTGNLKIQAVGNIDINANGIITVQGAMIKLN
ncbi:MAG: VgrG-related protein [Stenomitos frigidus ULC029]